VSESVESSAPVAEWCLRCCTRHGPGADCPGELLATGAERHGRRVTVAAGARNEDYGVLIADCQGIWRARIVTYPNMLWSVPGGRGTMKFVGATPQTAERAALDFIQQHCRSRGYKIVAEAEAVESGAIDHEYAARRQGRGAREERHLRRLPVRFGAERPDQTATTADLSRAGLFVITDRPLSTNRAVKLRLELGGFAVPLEGRVAWVRLKAEGADRPVGMGLELDNPPPMYVRWVLRLGDQDSQSAEGGPR